MRRRKGAVSLFTGNNYLAVLFGRSLIGQGSLSKGLGMGWVGMSGTSGKPGQDYGRQIPSIIPLLLRSAKRTSSPQTPRSPRGPHGPGTIGWKLRSYRARCGQCAGTESNPVHPESWLERKVVLVDNYDATQTQAGDFILELQSV